jgi:lysyl-tRNA synthetase class II
MKTIYAKLNKYFHLVPDSFSVELLKEKYKPGKIFRVKLIDDKKNRSFEQLKLYWILMKYLEYNTPEPVEKLFGHLSQQAWHEIMKSHFLISSVAIDKYGQDEFTDYFDKVQKWVSSYLLQVKHDTLMDYVINWYGGYNDKDI